MDKIISKNNKSDKKIYFISPHLDDAILSCGQLIAGIKDKSRINIINVFTDYGRGEQTLSAKMHLKYSGYKSLESLYQQRIKEDRELFENLGIKATNLMEKEALWREVKNPHKTEKILSNIFPEFNFIYPTFKFHVSKGKIFEDDFELINRLSNKLEKIIPKNSIVLCPVGVGGHVDHLVVREAVSKKFNPIYWLDQPYANNGKEKDFNFTSYQNIKNIKSSDVKRKLIEKYESQVSLFENNIIPALDEKYFVNKSDYRFNFDEELTKEFINEWKKLWSNSVSPHYFNSYEWYKTLSKIYNNKKLYVASLRKNNELVAIITLTREKLYGVSVYKNPGGRFIDRNSIILKNSNKDIIEEFLNQLAKYDKLILNEVEESIQLLLQNRKDVVFQESNTNFNLPFENNPFRFMKKEDRRKVRKIMNENPNKFRLVMGAGDLNLFNIAIKIDKKSYREKKNIGTFRDPANTKFFYELIKCNPKNAGINILYFRDKPIAYEIGIRSNNIYYGLNKSFDNKYIKLTPGKILAYLLFDGLYKEGIKAFDFARGEDMLKKSFTNIKFKQYDVYLFKPVFEKLWVTKIKYLRDTLAKNSMFYGTYRKALAKLI